MGPFGPEKRRELGGVDVVETPLNIQEERGGLEAKALEEADLVGEGSGDIKG